MSKDVFDKLHKALDTREGIIAEYKENADKKLSSVHFQINWPGGISFTVRGWDHFSWYSVERDNQSISPVFHYKKISDKDLGIMQNLINEVENGKYKGKKNLSEQIMDTVQKRQLTSCMNKTKWKELFEDISKIPNLEIQYKTLFDEEEPEDFWRILDDEYFFNMNTAQIERFIISATIIESKKLGLLLEPKESILDVKEQIESILVKHSIYYEYSEKENYYIVFGYK